MKLLSGLKALRLANGQVLKDAYVVEDFVEDRLGLNSRKIWDDLLAIDKEPVLADQSRHFPEIEHMPFKARLIPGTHHALKYRGNAATRDKTWFQTNIEAGYLKYWYTGWQHMISTAQCAISAMPKSTQDLMEGINNLLPQEEQMNHGIFTMYKDGTDCIGANSDKLQSFANKSWFIVIKLGASRYFEFTDLDGARIYHEKLKAGTALIVKSDTANTLTKHAVPPMKGLTEASGSIVFRRISQVVPGSEQLEYVKKARQEKLKKRQGQEVEQQKTKRQRI